MSTADTDALILPSCSKSQALSGSSPPCFKETFRKTHEVSLRTTPDIHQRMDWERTEGKAKKECMRKNDDASTEQDYWKEIHAAQEAWVNEFSKDCQERELAIDEKRKLRDREIAQILQEQEYNELPSEIPFLLPDDVINKENREPLKIEWFMPDDFDTIMSDSCQARKGTFKYPLEKVGESRKSNYLVIEKKDMVPDHNKE